jgi:hypothetical protein
VTTAKTRTRDTQTKAAVAHELALKIDAHLKRFERDPKINFGKRYDQERKRWVRDPMGLRDYFGANARGDRQRVRVIYIAYQGGSYLPIADAERYLAWLDGGNVGRHFEALREVAE